MVSVPEASLAAEGKKRKRHSVAQVKGNWSSSDDENLIRLVQEHGEGSWSLIAQSFPGRIGKQCRERWNNQLRPDIRRDAWTHAEEVLLVAAHKDVGNRWAEIAKDISGRTENAVKNHWNATLRKSAKKSNAAVPGGLAHYMRSNSMKHSGPQRSRSNTQQPGQQQAGLSIASNSSNTGNVTCSDENNDPVSSGDGADSKCFNSGAAHANTHKGHVTQQRPGTRAGTTKMYESDSDFSEEYAPSQHASRSSRYTARRQKHGAHMAPNQGSAADVPPVSVRPRTASLHSSTEVPLPASHTSARQPGQASAAPLAACQRFCMPVSHRRGDPRLESMVQDKFAAVTQSKAEEEMLLRSLQDLVPDELLSAELSDMDAFCLDSALDAASPGLQEAAATLRAGSSAIAGGVLPAQPPLSQYSCKPSDPRLVRPGLHSHHHLPQQQQPSKPVHLPSKPVHLPCDPRQRENAPGVTSCSSMPLGKSCGLSPNQAAKLKVAGMRQGGRDKEGGETLGLQQRQPHALPATHTSTASSSSNVAGIVQGEGMAEQHHSLAGPRASSQAPASQLCVQSSDNIHIQMEPLHSMDRYAAKLMCPTMELAIYSGRCPLTMLATHHPPRPLQQQALTNLQRVCGWVRASSEYRVGSLLIAVRAGHVPPGVAGLVIAASARDKSLALQAVQAAVKQVEALGALNKDMQRV